MVCRLQGHRPCSQKVHGYLDGKQKFPSCELRGANNVFVTDGPTFSPHQILTLRVALTASLHITRMT